MNLIYMNKMKLLAGRKKILRSRERHCVLSAWWKCFVAGYFLQNMHIAKLTSPEVASESGVSTAHIQRHMSLTTECSSQRGHPGGAGLIFLPFLQRRSWDKTLETQTRICPKAQLQETSMNFWGWHTHYLVLDLTGLGKLSWIQGKVWTARQIWHPRGGQQVLRKVSELPEVVYCPEKSFYPTSCWQWHRCSCQFVKMSYYPGCPCPCLLLALYTFKPELM